jgi:nitrile hydratase accessory protein
VTTVADQRSAELAELPLLPRDDDGPVFEEPWQAQAFAIAVSLIEAGHFTWQEWSATLGDEISHAAQRGIAEDGTGYYELWLNALERLVNGSGMASVDELTALKQAWHDAYASTPHGHPVKL